MSHKMDQNVLMPWQQTKDAGWALNNQLSNWKHLLSCLVQSTIMSSVRRWMWIKMMRNHAQEKINICAIIWKKPKTLQSLRSQTLQGQKCHFLRQITKSKETSTQTMLFVWWAALSFHLLTVKEHWCDTSVRNVMTPSLKTTRQYYNITTANLEKLRSN